MKTFLLLLLLLVPFNVSALSLTLTWINPAEREDNSALLPSEIAGYRAYIGTTQGDYTITKNVTGYRTLHKLTLPFSTDYYIVLTVVDTEGRESAYSRVVYKQFSRPNKPSFTFGKLDEPEEEHVIVLKW